MLEYALLRLATGTHDPKQELPNKPKRFAKTKRANKKMGASMFNNNDNEDINKELHLADSDYRHLNLPKHENVNLKEKIAQMQQSTLQPASEENATLFPFHINLAQADVPATPPAAVEPLQEAPVQNDAAQVEPDVAEEEIDLEEELLAEDPGVLLLPDTIDEVIRIEIARDTKAGLIVVDDDGSQELYRIKHNNNGLVQDEPRDLGLPPIDYPTQKLFVPFIAPLASTPEPEECCSIQVEIKLTTQLIYLGDYCCGYEGEEGEEYLYSSNYGWEGEGEGGSCGCGCEPYDPPSPPTPNYTIVFNNCDGEQWLDLTICNSYGGETERSSFNAINEGGCGCGSEYQSSYDDCCTTYRIEIPASFGLDCDCPILTLQTDKLFIEGPWDLIKSDSHFIDCHGNCFEIRPIFEGSGTFATTEFDISSIRYELESCECNEYVQISLVNELCDVGELSSGSYSYQIDTSSIFQDFSFSFGMLSYDTNNDGASETIIKFQFNDSNGTTTFDIQVPEGVNCACPIEEIVFDESNFASFVNSHGSTAVTATEILNYFETNGFFEDCKDQCFELGTGPALEQCTDCEPIALNVTFGCDDCDTYNRFQNWVANVAPGSFDPFQFFTDNVHFSLVDCNNTAFIEVNYLDINESLGEGYYATTQETLRISLPDGFCIDDFNEVVVEPKMIYESYQDSCYQFGYDIEDVLYDLLDNNGIHVINTKTGAEYVSIYDDCSGDTLVPASCEDAICINPVNPVCQTEEGEEAVPLFANIQANFNGSGCCGGECNTEYSYQTIYGLVSFGFEFEQNQYADLVVFHYKFTDDTNLHQDIDTSIPVYASNNDLGCTNPLENFVFDEKDFQQFLNSITIESGSSIEASVVLDYFSNNGYFEDCQENCFEINREQENGDFPWVLQSCTDCTHIPITVSIDDASHEVVTFNAEAVNKVTDADKLAYFQQLYSLEYIDCNGANFVEFTYYYNNSDEGCEYNSFPACCETIRISIEDCCGGEDGEDATSPITQLVLDSDFISDFFDNHFVDYCGNISYNIAQGWGSDFLNYIISSESEFKTQDGASYQLNQDECGNYVIPSDCETCCIDVPVDITLNDPVSQPYVVVFNFFRPLTYTYTSDVDGHIYNGLLVNTQAREDGLVVRTGVNDFTFNFTYTNCDVNSDGIIENFLTFQIDTKFTVTDLTISGNTSVISFESDPPLLEFDIVAPVNNSDCCSFTLMFDEKDFVDRLMTINRTLSPELGGQTILDTLITIGKASFTDCDDNQYVIVKNGNDYSLQANASGPVIFDLTGDGFNLTTVKQGVLYDVVGDSAKEKTAWIGEGNGLLVYDADQNHTVSNASEFVLTDHVPGAKTDLEALRIGFDSNHDNLFDQQDAAWNLFGIWQDINKDAVVDNGEYHSLAQIGIVSIGLSTEQGSGHIVNGNVIHGVTSFTWADGSTGKAADATLNYNDIVQDVHNDTSVTDPAVSNPTVAEQSQVVMAQNDPVVQSAVEQLANQAAVASA